ncbi:MAG TPA: hypothetical protein VFC19_34265 [Candidatus Limnocylindrales bacterium]|nr:hypothetical protein [Candidatus Limnocylindrales bacterium]
MADYACPPMMSPLERRYRLLLKAYPAEYRAVRGDEIVATLLDNARPGQRVPSPADVADILGHALRRRFSPDLQEAAGLAAPWALALIAGVAGFVWWRVEPMITTTGPIAYAAWLLAAAGAVLLPSAARRPLIGLALAATLAAALTAPIMGVQRPPIWVIMSLLGLGCIALTRRAAFDTESRLNIAAASVAVTLTCHLFSPRVDGYYQPVIARIGAVVAIGVLATAVVAFHRKRQGRSPRSALLAGLVLALPATWLGPIDAIEWQFPVDSLTAARFGRLAHVIVATCAVVCLLALMNHSRPLLKARLSAILVGGALGFAAFAGAVAWPRHVTVTIVVLALTALLLGTRPRIPTLLITAALTLLACWLIGVYSNDWTAIGWSDPSRTVVLASMLTIAPCSLTVLIGLPQRSAAIIPSSIWISYLVLPALLAWGPLLWALAVGAIIAAGHKLLASR